MKVNSPLYRIDLVGGNSRGISSYIRDPDTLMFNLAESLCVKQRGLFQIF